MVTSGDGLRLEWSLRALAQPAAIQQQLFPEFSECSDELALTFEEGYREAQQLPEWKTVTEEQRAAVDEVDRYLEWMSQRDGDLWTESALRTSLEWSRVRHLSRRALVLLGWSEEPPPTDTSIYVRT